MRHTTPHPTPAASRVDRDRGRHPRGRARMAGVTLLELMIVVMVIGVLSMIAMPSYRQYVMRAQRTEAKSALLRLATNQERFYLTNRTYGGDANLDDLGFVDGLSERGTYVLTIDDADATGYTATATPTGGGDVDMRGDAQCTSFSITSQGLRTATGGDPDACW